MSRGPDGDLEHVPLLGHVVDDGADPSPPQHGACTIRLPELIDATHEEVADLTARIQRAVDEWSSAKAGESVRHHTGRRYGSFNDHDRGGERASMVVAAGKVCCANCGTPWRADSLMANVHFEQVCRVSGPERCSIDGVVVCHECFHCSTNVFGLRILDVRTRGPMEDFAWSLLEAFKERDGKTWNGRWLWEHEERAPVDTPPDTAVPSSGSSPNGEGNDA